MPMTTPGVRRSSYQDGGQAGLSRVEDISRESGSGNKRNALSGFLDSLDQDEVHEQIIVSLSLLCVLWLVDNPGRRYRLPLP
jgi:hypothetical protein